MKDRNDYTWDELVGHNTRNIHDGLLEGGGRGMKSAVYMTMVHTLEWRAEQDKKKEKTDPVEVVEQAIKEWASDEFIEVARARSLADHIVAKLKG